MESPRKLGKPRSDFTLDWPKRSKWKSLLGFLGRDQAITIIKSQGIRLEDKEEQDLVEQINKAVNYVNSLSGRKNLKPERKEVPSPSWPAREAKLRAEPTFQEHLIGMDEHSFAMVEIAKIHAFQPNLNPDYIERLRKRAPKPGQDQELLQFCLPLKTEVAKTPALGGFNPNTNTFTLTSENLDLRILGQVQGEDPNTGRSFFGFQYGGGLPQISVVEYKGLYMIKNGYHRAYALHEAGHKFLPCILLKTEQYSSTGAAGPGFFNIDLMLSDKSPLIPDFDSPAAVVYPRPLIRVIASIHAEVQVIPV